MTLTKGKIAYNQGSVGATKLRNTKGLVKYIHSLTLPLFYPSSDTPPWYGGHISGFELNILDLNLILMIIS